jgi:hypothetical protein
MLFIMNKKNYKEAQMDIRTLIELAQQFGLPCIVRKDYIAIIGEKEILQFNIKENNECLQNL